MADGLEQVSVESNGRVLTGMGADEASLRETMERHAPEPAESAGEPPQTTVPAAPSSPRNEQGQFTKPTRGQKRFDQLTGEREAEKRAREAVEQERDALRAELAAARRPPEPAQPAAPAPVAATPKQDEKFTFPTFETWLTQHPDAVSDPNAWETWQDEKIDARTDWKLKTGRYVAADDFDARLRTSIEADRASRSFADTVEQVLTKGRAAFQDFDAVRTSGPGSKVGIPQPRLDYLLSQPHAATLIYAIAKDAALAQKLASVPDLAFGAEVAALAPAQGVASPASTPRASSVTLPPPYQPVGSGSTTTVPPSAELAKGFDYDASGYREKRAAERGVLRRR